MLREMGMSDNAPVTLLEDNQACMDIANKDIASPKLKHVDIRFHFVRTMVHEGKVQLIYWPSYHQAADILTKGVDSVAFFRHRATLMGLPFWP